jgi:ABC-type sugar transport system ATPase subunit
MLREQATRVVHLGPDPLGVSLSFAGDGADREELASWLRARRDSCALAAAQLEEDRERMVARGQMGPLQAAVMYRGQLHAETEVRWHDEFAKILAGMPPDEESGGQAELYRVPHAEIAGRIERLTRQLDLGGLEDRLVKTLSGGQPRRLDIALGLVHSPRLVFLDEPTTGLDPQSRSNLWDHIRRLREDLGTTVFLTTHYLDEADALCDRILVIDYGKIVAEGTPDELKRRTRPPRPRFPRRERRRDYSFTQEHLTCPSPATRC